MMRRRSRGKTRTRRSSMVPQKEKACVLWCLSKKTRFRKTGLVKSKGKKGLGSWKEYSELKRIVVYSVNRLSPQTS